MAVFRWGHALDAFRDLEREMDRLLRSVNLGFEGLRVARQYPPVNIYELDGEYLLTAELPGTRRDDLEVSVADGLVTIRGVRRGAAEVAEDRFRRSERPRGAWERTLSLPDRVQEEGMYAELNQGVLRLHLPKAPSAQPRQIRVVEAGQPPKDKGRSPS
jgi:HSP20 family protein